MLRSAAMGAPMNKVVRAGIVVMVTGALSCSGADTPDHIRLSQPNGIGVVALDIQRSDDVGNSVFVLSGVDAANHEVASVRLEIGTIADMTTVLPGNNTYGSEIVLAA